MVHGASPAGVGSIESVPDETPAKRDRDFARHNGSPVASRNCIVERLSQFSGALSVAVVP